MSVPDWSHIELRLMLEVPLRDGVCLNGTLYVPRELRQPSPCIVAMTPYESDHLHDRGVYFATRGFPFLAVDVRGRGNSEGTFRPMLQEARDGYDVVEWAARQPYCNGNVGMYGGSYLGYVQWATASECPPHLSTIVPTAACYLGVDLPGRSNIVSADCVRWLALVAGRTNHWKLYSDTSLWSAAYRRWYASGRPFRGVDEDLGHPSKVFQEWVSHPAVDAYWDSYNPTPDQLARLTGPVLTITGIYDGNQPGALAHYRQHMRHASDAERDQHYLVIGPWNHANCALPSAEFDGLEVGQASVIDMYGLHADWYGWTMRGGPKPALLQKRVAYYVTGAERWRYAETLDGVTERWVPYYLYSQGNPTDIFAAGWLTELAPHAGSRASDHYIYDPSDFEHVTAASATDATGRIVDQRLVHTAVGKQLIYHSAPFEADTEISGFFKLVAWISMDQPDTDFGVRVYEVDNNGRNVLLATDFLRARYRQSSHTAALIRTQEPLCYEFVRFTFTSRLVKKGNRLRLVFGPTLSIDEQRNYNSGGVVADESIKDARAVRVELLHDASHQSALYVPLGRVAR